MKMLQCLNPCQLHHYFVDFVNMKCMSWFTFLHLEKMELCFVVGPRAEPTDTPFETPAPTSPLRPIKAEEHYLRRQLSQSHRAQQRITDDLSLLGVGDGHR